MKTAAICLALALTGCASTDWVRTGHTSMSLASAKANCVAGPADAVVEPAERLMTLDRCMEQRGWARPATLPARNEKR
jgi:hypothetical protein